MAEKSRLAEVLGLEEDEEFKIESSSYLYRIHEGRREIKFYGEWHRCDSEDTLINIINNPSCIIHKPRFSDEEMTFLRLLHKYGVVRKIHKGEYGYNEFTTNGKLIIDNIAELLKPGETIDLDEMFKEGDNG